ncbi:DUF1501 domain-containing protein [Akkermansiaceae bacterium]|nr:DUF1501 domain-containing protein [Akkermansiaceae bacterium]
MHGGPSTVDLFDPKPLLVRDNGKPFPLKVPRITSHKSKNLLLKSPWSCAQHGESGAQVSELLPHIASITDDLCFVRSMHGSNSRHGGGFVGITHRIRYFHSTFDGLVDQLRSRLRKR